MMNMMNKVYAVLSSFFLIVLAGCLSFTTTTVKENSKVSPFEPKIEIESLNFYTADEKGLEKSYRVYNNSFRLNSIDLIWYELIVRNLTAKNAKITYKEVWLSDDDNVISSVIKDMSIKSTDKYLEYSAGIKTDWLPGYFTLKLYQDGLEIASEEFKIVE
ncbi:MAG: hypothetical protein KKD38_02800 [Candidatus Delongbacteria bacterium]|nr:hypothetical protein [Candidatus Delongbacteria bacterium]MCG2761261.1 hypothetical protein [Candidatus Delongbacteria bacterium]